MAKEKRPSIFAKALSAGEAYLEAQIQKAKNSMVPDDGASYNFGKAVTRDRYYQIGAQGFYEKTESLGYDFQKAMAKKSSVVAAIIKTRAGKASAYTEHCDESDARKGFKISLKKASEKKLLAKIKEELQNGQLTDNKRQSSEQASSSNASEMRKAEGDPENPQENEPQVDPEKKSEENQAPTEQDLERQAKKELEERTQEKRQQIAEFIKTCGELKDRPFEAQKWNFDAFMRALVWDTLTYDQIGVEMVPKEAQTTKDGKFNVHHFQPVDGSTIRFASPQLKRYRDHQMLSGYDILYPEDELKALEERDALELDPERLEEGEYKYVQVIRGRIERAFTADELAMGMRNPVTDVYANGYSLSELELLVALISSHLHTEFYNRSYFSQGFSAKGILHIKANLNRSKLEELRRHWNHMVKGSRNSFQTPIMSGMDEVEWIPLTQNHSEMEFSLWLNYLIKMICAIYQIDPAEIGYGMKEEGGSGGSLGGDNTSEKLKESHDKGMVPMMKFFQSFINTNIIDKIDPDYQLEWVGLEEESPGESLNRRKEEVKAFKSVNEVREEAGLRPIEGCDDLILDTVFFQWFSQFHPDGQKLQEKNDQKEQEQMLQQQAMGADQGAEGDQQAPEEPSPEDQAAMEEEAKQADHERDQEAADAELDRQKELESHKAKLTKKTEPVKKSVTIERYTLESSD